MREFIKINKQLFQLEEIEIKTRCYPEIDPQKSISLYLTEISIKSAKNSNKTIEKMLEKTKMYKQFGIRFLKYIEVYEKRGKNEHKLDLNVLKSFSFKEISNKDEEEVKNTFYLFVEDLTQELIKFLQLRPGISMSRFAFIIEAKIVKPSDYKVLHRTTLKQVYSPVDFRQQLFHLPDLDNSVPTP